MVCSVQCAVCTVVFMMNGNMLLMWKLHNCCCILLEMSVNICIGRREQHMNTCAINIEYCLFCALHIGWSSAFYRVRITHSLYAIVGMGRWDRLWSMVNNCVQYRHAIVHCISAPHPPLSFSVSALMRCWYMISMKIPNNWINLTIFMFDLMIIVAFIFLCLSTYW